MTDNSKNFILSGGPHDGQGILVDDGFDVAPMSKLIEGNWHISTYIKKDGKYVFEKTKITKAERVQ